MNNVVWIVENLSNGEALVFNNFVEADDKAKEWIYDYEGVCLVYEGKPKYEYRLPDPEVIRTEVAE